MYSKSFRHFFQKNFFNLSEIFLIIMLYGTSIDSGIDTKFFQYFNIAISECEKVSHHDDDVLLSSAAIILSSILKVREFWKAAILGSGQALVQRRNTT